MIGTAILACAIVGASIYYWLQIRSLPPAIDDLAAGYTKARERQMGIMMGTMGVMMVGWLDTLGDPGAQATIVVAIAAIVAALCFRAAWLMDLPESDERRWPQ